MTHVEALRRALAATAQALEGAAGRNPDRAALIAERFARAAARLQALDPGAFGTVAEPEAASAGRATLAELRAETERRLAAHDACRKREAEMEAEEAGYPTTPAYPTYR